MKYYKPSKFKLSYLYVGIFILLLSTLIYSFRGQIYRSAVTINLGTQVADIFLGGAINRTRNTVGQSTGLDILKVGKNSGVGVAAIVMRFTFLLCYGLLLM